MMSQLFSGNRIDIPTKFHDLMYEKKNWATMHKHKILQQTSIPNKSSCARKTLFLHNQTPLSMQFITHLSKQAPLKF